MGDSGYPQKPFLMTPIVNALPGSPEFLYTQHHIRTRVSVERCNGLLKARFRCLSSDKLLRYAPDIVGNIVNACAALHNICIRGNLQADFEVPIDQEDDNHEVEHLQGNDAGFVARRHLIARYFT